MIRPSSLPMLKVCPCYEGSPSEATEAGSDRHAALAAHFGGDDSLLALLPDEDAEGVRWAAEYIRLKAPMADYPIQFEQRVSPMGEDFAPLFENGGTADCICGGDLFDLKWRERDYSAQMAAYALALFDAGWEVVRVHVLFGAFQRVEFYTLTREQAWAIVEPILAAARAPERKATPCDYCGWCAHCVTCPELNLRGQTVGQGREDWKLQTYHTSEILDPRQMARALDLADALEAWCEAVKHHAKEMVLRQGVQIPGRAIQERAGAFEVTDLPGACRALGLSEASFLRACKVTLGKLEAEYAVHIGVAKVGSAVKKEIAGKLAPFGARKASTVSLVRSKE